MAISRLADGQQTVTNRCKVCVALDELPPKEAAGLRSLLANPKWRFTELSDALAADPDYPLQIHGDLLGKHARGKCAAGEKLR